MNEEPGTKNQELNPKNIILRNPKIPGQVRRARKSELKWYAQRGWVPEKNVEHVGADPRSANR